MEKRRSVGTSISKARWLWGALTLVLVGCATTPTGENDLLDFLKDGVTTREDVFLALGDPNASYEDSRILTYRLTQDEAGWILRKSTRDWLGVRVVLVIVFDDRGTVKRHSLVQVRSE